MAEAQELRLLLTADAVGGVWTHAVELAAGLSAAGVTTTLATLGPAPTPRQIAAAELYPGVTVAPTGLPLDWLARSPGEISHAAEALAAFARAASADVVHLHSGAYALASYDAPVIVSCHSCLATWWAAMHGGEPPADFQWRTAATAHGYVAADRLVAPTAAFAAATRTTYELAEEPAVVPNGIGDAPPDEAVAPGVPQVFTAGRLWDEAKNLATLDSAARGIAAPFEAAGALTSPDGAAAIRLEAIRPLGHVGADDVRARLARRPIFASAARYEPFGLAALEAARAGCPLVLSDIPTLRELWDGAALFSAPDDAGGFAGLINALLEAPEERARLGALARRRARRFTRGAMTSGMLRLYRDALADPGHVGAAA